MNEFYIKGLAYAAKDAYKDAIAAFSQSIKLDPNHVEAWYNRGLAKFYMENYLEAVQDFDQALVLNPDNATIYSQRGVAKFLLNELPTALQDMDKALALEPQNAYRYTSRAYIRAKIGDVQSAIDDYHIALKLDPEDAIAWNNLGMLEQSLGWKQSAEDRFSKADGIADEGQVFEKPDLDELLRDAKEERELKEQKLEAISQSKLDKKPYSRPISVTNDEQPTNVDWTFYWKTIKDVLGTKQGLTDFWKFVKQSPSKKS